MNERFYILTFDAGRLVALEAETREAAAEFASGATLLLATETELLQHARERRMVLEVHPLPPHELRRHFGGSRGSGGSGGSLRPLLALAS
jgi:hypothetical protein